MTEIVSGFRIRVPSLEGTALPPGTMVLLLGRPGAGKSVFAEQFMRDGLKFGQNGIYIATDTPADSIRKRAITTLTGPEVHVMDLFQEKPRLINDVSIAVHQTISKFVNSPVRVVFDSLSTLGMMFKPDVLPPWVLDQRARFVRNNANVLALMIYDTGIHPPTVLRSLQVLADVVLEMKLDESGAEPTHLFRIFSTRGVPHSAKWYPFTIDDTGLRFGPPLS